MSGSCCLQHAQQHNKDGATLMRVHPDPSPGATLQASESAVNHEPAAIAASMRKSLLVCCPEASQTCSGQNGSNANGLLILSSTHPLASLGP